MSAFKDAESERSSLEPQIYPPKNYSTFYPPTSIVTVLKRSKVFVHF